MRDMISILVRWQKEGRPIALATVIETWGSSPRGVGSKMALTLDGQFIGSVSGGCVESAVIEAGVECLRTHQPRLLHFGVTDETAWEVGLACGGSIDIFVQPLDRGFLDELLPVINARRPAATATIIRGPGESPGRWLLVREDGRLAGSLGDSWTEQVAGLASEVLLQGASRRVVLDGEVEVFLDAIQPSPTLVAVGGVHIAVALARLAHVLGYWTVVIDPRQVWGNEHRFPHVDQLVPAWPEQAFRQIRLTHHTAVATLTHDPKLDEPALKIALPSPAFYVGALGSARTHARRRGRLLAEGVSESELARLHAPIGLDIGAQSPEEIALAVMAEVVEAHRMQNRVPAAREAQAASNP